MSKYGVNSPRGPIHIQRDGHTAYCGEWVEDLYETFNEAKDTGRYDACSACLKAKHVTDVAKDTLDIGTTGSRPEDFETEEEA